MRERARLLGVLGVLLGFLAAPVASVAAAEACGSCCHARVASPPCHSAPTPPCHAEKGPCRSLAPTACCDLTPAPATSVSKRPQDPTFADAATWTRPLCSPEPWRSPTLPRHCPTAALDSLQRLSTVLRI